MLGQSKHERRSASAWQCGAAGKETRFLPAEIAWCLAETLPP